MRGPWLEGLNIGGGELVISGGATECDAKVGDLVEGEGVGSGGCGDGKEVGAGDVLEVERRARVGIHGRDFDMTEFEVADVTKEKAAGGHGSEHGRVGVLVDILRRYGFDEIGVISTLVLDVDVGELDVLDVVVGYAGEDGAELGLGVVADEVVDDDALHGPDDGALIAGAARATEARAEAKEERRADEIALGDVGDGDVFDERTVLGFDGQPHATFEDAVGDGDITEAAVGFGAELDAAIADRSGCVGSEFLEGAIEDRAELVVAGDLAVGDGDVVGGAVVAEGEAGLEADGIVTGGVDGEVGDANVFAAVDVDAVAVGVDLEIVDGEVVYTGEEEAEVSPFEDGKVAEDDVAAVLEGDGFVADTGLLGGVAGVVAARGAVGSETEAFAVDEAGAGNGEIVDVFAPEEGVVPVIVAVVLECAVGCLGSWRRGCHPYSRCLVGEGASRQPGWSSLVRGRGRRDS